MGGREGALAPRSVLPPVRRRFARSPLLSRRGRPSLLARRAQAAAAAAVWACRARGGGLYVSSMSVGSFGRGSPGAEVKRDDTPCAFATLARGRRRRRRRLECVVVVIAVVVGRRRRRRASAATSSSSGNPRRSRAAAASMTGRRSTPTTRRPRRRRAAGYRSASRAVAARARASRCRRASSSSRARRRSTLTAQYRDKCKTRREARKKLQVWSLPHVLVVHLKRFSAQGMWRKKNDTPVDFPFEIDLAKYALCQPGDEDRDGGGGGSESSGESAATAAAASSMYDLQAVSNHYGSTGGGHYTAFAKNSVSGLWHKFDDSHAVVEAKDVVTPAAYVLITSAGASRALRAGRRRRRR